MKHWNIGVAGVPAMVREEILAPRCSKNSKGLHDVAVYLLPLHEHPYLLLDEVPQLGLYSSRENKRALVLPQRNPNSKYSLSDSQNGNLSHIIFTRLTNPP
jgi:hypothetical protein